VQTWAQFQRIAEEIRDGIDTGLHTGVQVYASVAGETRLDDALGEAAPNVPLRTDTLMPWLSSCKPITAVAIAQLVERGALAYDDPVARYLPAFAQNGKEAITLRHLLTHTGGFRDLAKTSSDESLDETLEKVFRLPVEAGWVPGERAGYHPRTSWVVLAALVETQTGRAYGDWLREEIFLPLGMTDCWMGLPEDARAAYGERLGMLQGTDPRQKTHSMVRAADLISGRARPGGGAIGPINQLARFYQMLLNGGTLEGQRLLEAATVRELTSRQREGMLDETFRHTMDWGLGFMIDSKRYGKETLPYSFGDHASDAAFGHGGMQSSVGFADPAHGLVVAVVFNGMPGEPRHHRRIRAFCTALYEDLGL
jgi:CubicO group peptidase (beta-lactamase class C family)